MNMEMALKKVIKSFDTPAYSEVKINESFKKGFCKGWQDNVLGLTPNFFILNSNDQMHRNGYINGRMTQESMALTT